MFVQVKGPDTGVPVVLIHGTAAWSELWRGTIDFLAGNGYRVIALDLPPFGFSDRPADRNYTRSAQAERIRGVLDGLKIDKAILVGHSFGGGATVETVMRYPERVRGLVLVAAAVGLPQPGETPAQPSPLVMGLLGTPIIAETLVAATVTNPLLTRRLLAMMLAKHEAATPQLAAVLARPMTLKSSTPDFAVWLRFFLSPDTAATSARREAFGRIGARTRLIWGDLDTLTPLDQGKDLERLIPGARMQVLGGVGHIPQIEDPAAFRPALAQALIDVAN